MSLVELQSSLKIVKLVQSKEDRYLLELRSLDCSEIEAIKDIQSKLAWLFDEFGSFFQEP